MHPCISTRYRLLSFMATDKFGSGAFAQQSLIDGETTAKKRSALYSLKTNNPCWTKVKVIVIDKDFAELSLLAEQLPSATIILCQFHVLDYLNREVGKQNYRFTDYQIEHLRNLFRLLVYSNTEVLFDLHMPAIEQMARSEVFGTYFSNNWLSCKRLWATHLHGSIPHLDNNTNNRLEASWGAAKGILRRHMAMDKCISTLLFLQQSSADQYMTMLHKVSFRFNSRYDVEMQMLARISSQFACEAVESEYNFSIRVRDIYNQEPSPVGQHCYTLTSSSTGMLYAVRTKLFCATTLMCWKLTTDVDVCVMSR